MGQNNFHLSIHERMIKNNKRIIIAAVLFLIASIIISSIQVFPVNAVASDEMISGPIIDIVENDDSIDVKIRVSEENKDNDLQLWLSEGEGWVDLKDTKIKEKDIENGIFTTTVTLDEIKKASNKENKSSKLSFSSDSSSLYVKYLYKKDDSDKQYSTETIVSPSVLQSASTQSSTPVQSNSSDVLEIFKAKDYTNKPFQVQAGVKVNILSDNKNGSVSIVGSKGIMKTIDLNNSGKAEWTPDERGIFYLNITGTDVKRKIYVNAREYLHICELSLNNFMLGTLVSVKSKNVVQQSSAVASNPKSKIDVTIGDPGVWSKTIRSETVGQNSQFYYSVFPYLFNSGNYYVRASQKNVNSVEYEAEAGKMYKQRGLDNLELKLGAKVGSTEIKSGDTYSVNTKFDFTATPVNKKDGKNYSCADNLEYIFLLYDKNGLNGTNTVTKYSDENIYAWTPTAPGTYVIYARVKQKSIAFKNPLIDNSYEAEAKFEVNVTGSGTGEGIKVDTVKINDRLKDVDITDPSLRLRAHNLYTIKIGDVPQNNVMYKVYSFNYYDDTSDDNPCDDDKGYSNNGNTDKDGVWEALSNFTFENEIPFYPKSFGKYKIIILAKFSDAGSQQVSKSYEIEVSK